MKTTFDSSKLKEERLRCGYSFLEFSRALQKHEPKATKTLVWKWERGAQPTMRYAKALANVLGRDISFFYK
jgi:transcriptional regulator with XRE-family HTH domain